MAACQPLFFIYSVFIFFFVKPAAILNLFGLKNVSKLASALLMPNRIKRLLSVSKLPQPIALSGYKCFRHLLLANIFYAFFRRIAAALKIYLLRHSARFLAATYSLSTFFEYDCSPTVCANAVSPHRAYCRFALCSPQPSFFI